MGGNVTNVTLSERQLKRLDPALRRACELDATTRATVAHALSKYDYSYVNQYYREHPDLIDGLIVERNSEDGSIVPPSEARAKEATTSKEARELLTHEWQGYFRDRYYTNKDEARHDMVRLLCHKEVKKLQVAYSDLWKVTDSSDPERRAASMRLRLRYINETKERQDEYTRKVNEFVEKNKDKLNDPKLITAYRNAFCPKTQGDNISTNTRNTIEALTEADLKALAQFTVLNDMTAIGGENGMSEEQVAMACEEMAIEAITDRNINRGVVKINEYTAEIRQIKEKYADTPEIKALTGTYIVARAKTLEEIDKAQTQADKEKWQKALAELEAKYDEDCLAALPEKAQKQIKNLKGKIAKESQKANDKENEFMNENMDELIELAAEAKVQVDIQKQKYDTHVVPAFSALDKDVQAFIKSNPEAFGCRAVKEGETADFEVEIAGEKKQYKFDDKAYKEKMLYYSQRGRTSGDAQTNQEGCDYFCDLAELDNCFKGVKFGGLGDDENVKRKQVKKAMEAAGITTEADRTVQQRLAHILKSAGIGAVTGALGVLAADAISMLKTCEFTEQIFELASLTQMIPVTLTGPASLTGRYQNDYQLSGDDATWSFKDTYHLGGEDATWTFDKTVYVDHEHNGIVIDQYEIPVHGEGNNGVWSYDFVVDEHGSNGHWEYVHHVDEEVTVNGNVTLSGTVDNPDAGRELYDKGKEEHRKKHPTFSSPEVYGYAALAGAVAGAVKGAFEAHNIKDKGLRKDAETMRYVSQKEYSKKPEPVTIVEEEDQGEIEVEEGDGEEEIDETQQVAFKVEAEIDETEGAKQKPIQFSIEARKLEGQTVKGKDGKDYQAWEAHLWPSLYAAFHIEKADQAQFRREFRRKVLGGKDYYSNKEQSIISFNFKGVEIPFDRDAFYATPKDIYYQKAGVTSGNSSATGKQDPPTYTGSTTYTDKEGKPVTLTTTKTYDSATGAANDLRSQITSAGLSPAQQQEAFQKIETAEANPTKKK